MRIFSAITAASLNAETISVTLGSIVAIAHGPPRAESGQHDEQQRIAGVHVDHYGRQQPKDHFHPDDSCFRVDNLRSWTP